MTTNNLNFNQVIDALLDDDADFPVLFMMSLSDILPTNLAMLKKAWVLISPARKAFLMENIEVIHESEITSNFEDIAELALEDANSAVRISGLRLFWDYENSRLIKKIIDMMENDPDVGVRSQAASTLGKYMYLAEIEMIGIEYQHIIDKALIKVLRSNENELVRQKALEAFGYSSNPQVSELIHIAYNSGDYNWIFSSLEAMGRSADEKYTSLVLPMLAHPDLRIQREAIFAAGELEIASARKLLLRLAFELEQDEDLWVEAISALSKIGGEGVSEAFQKLLQNASTDEEEDFINEAIENLNLTNDMAIGFDLMGLKEPQEETFREINLEDQEFDIDDYSKSWVEELEENLESLIGDEFDEFDDDDDEEVNSEALGEDEDED
jgi:HEAT repeat protein